MKRDGMYYQELIAKYNFSMKSIGVRFKVSPKTLDNFLYDRLTITDKNFKAIDDAVMEEIISLLAAPAVPERDRVFKEIETVYYKLHPDMQIQTLEHVRGLERIDISRSNRN